MNITVFDKASIGEDLDYTPLSAHGELTVYDTSTPDQVKQRLVGCNVAVINKVKLSAEVLEHADVLKLICIFATGYDNIDVAYCREKGIAVCNVVGYSTESVAQLTVAMALSLSSHLPTYTASTASGWYSRQSSPNLLVPVYHELCGKTWGIVGYGNIGKKVGEIAKAFGCKVLAYKRNPDSPDCTDLETLLRESDIISLHTPLNAESRGMIGAEQIDIMNKKPIVINVARGAVWDEAAIATALTEGKISGLGCDVFSTEPFPVEHPFFTIKDAPNVCLTPHMAWASFEARTRCLDEICKNIDAFQKGEKRNRVDL
ncbi:MAG: hydroxyacid dehydrogenase [Clostridia bacterium]|nr:hydroxyacid dehydrogenase [Clostridia bacterium]